MNQERGVGFDEFINDKTMVIIIISMYKPLFSKSQRAHILLLPQLLIARSIYILNIASAIFLAFLFVFLFVTVVHETTHYLEHASVDDNLDRCLKFTVTRLHEPPLQVHRP